MPSVCFTGRGLTPAGLHKTREEWERQARAADWIVHRTVDFHTDYLVTADPACTKSKARRARALGVEPISYREFLGLIIGGNLGEMRARARQGLQPVAAEPIPSWACWDASMGVFVHAVSGVIQPPSFTDRWFARRAEFPRWVETSSPEPIPPGIYWSVDSGGFYDMATRRGTGLDFYNKWRTRRAEFPQGSTGRAAPIPAVNLILDFYGGEFRLTENGTGIAVRETAEELLEFVRQNYPVSAKLNVTERAADAASTPEDMAGKHCASCGSRETLAQIRKSSPTAFTCCPERKIVPIPDPFARRPRAINLGD